MDIMFSRGTKCTAEGRIHEGLRRSDIQTKNRNRRLHKKAALLSSRLANQSLRHETLMLFVYVAGIGIAKNHKAQKVSEKQRVMWYSRPPERFDVTAICKKER